MNIVVSTDDNFVQHCATMLVSLLENNKSGISIYLLSEGITNSNNIFLQEIVSSRGGFYYYIQVDPMLLNGFPMPDLQELAHISIATYYRLLIPVLLPKSVSKVIYLDCDIIVRKSIQELWVTNIDKYAIAAVQHMTNRTLEDTKRLKYPLKYGYFNAGVLLININYWRTNSISEKFLNYLSDNLNDIKYHDQDALNAVLFNKCLKLSCKWNMLPAFFTKGVLNVNDYENGLIINNYYNYKFELNIEPYDPTIIHFASKIKPWDIKCTHPYRKEYFNYLKKTAGNGVNVLFSIASWSYRKLYKFSIFSKLRKESYLKIKC